MKNPAARGVDGMIRFTDGDDATSAQYFTPQPYGVVVFSWTA